MAQLSYRLPGYSSTDFVFTMTLSLHPESLHIQGSDSFLCVILAEREAIGVVPDQEDRCAGIV